MKAMKQRDYFITILPICKWGSGILTINELHINRTEHWMTVSSIAFIIKEKPWQISASFYILLKWSGLQYISSEIHVHVALRSPRAPTNNKATH